MSDDERVDGDAAAQRFELSGRKSELPGGGGIGGSRIVEPFPVAAIAGDDEEGDRSQARAPAVG